MPLIELSAFTLRRGLSCALVGLALFVPFDEPGLAHTLGRDDVFEFPNTPNGPQAGSRDELDAFGRVVDGATPAETIVSAEAFARQYPDSQLLPLTLLREMQAEMLADSYEGAVAVGRELLRRDPKSLGALVLMAAVVPDFPPAFANRRAAILSVAERCVEDTRLALETFHLPQGVAARTFISDKRNLIISLREAARFVALVAGRYADAIRDYEWVLAQDTVHSPITYLRLGLAYYYAGKKDAARERLTQARRLGSEAVRRRAEEVLRELAF